MNSVQTILSSIPDDDLRKAVRELRELEDQGVLPAGIVRSLRTRLAAETGLSESDAVKVADASIYRLAAFKWAGA